MDFSVNNVSFGNRYLRAKKGSNVPKTIMDALRQNKAVDTFLQEGTPKTTKEKFLDLFKTNEYLEVALDRGVFAEYDILRFVHKKGAKKVIKDGGLEVNKMAVVGHKDYKIGCRWLHNGINFDISDQTFVKQIKDIKSMDEILGNIKRSTF